MTSDIHQKKKKNRWKKINNKILTLKDGSPIRRRQHCILSLAGPTHFHSGDTTYVLTAFLPSLLRLFWAWWQWTPHARTPPSARDLSSRTQQSASGCWTQCKYWGTGSGGPSGGGTWRTGGNDAREGAWRAGTPSSSPGPLLHPHLLAPPEVALQHVLYLDHLQGKVTLWL